MSDNSSKTQETADGAVTTPNEGATNDTQKSEIETLKAEADKFKNEYLYLRAEFENYKRHAIKERSDLLKYGPEKLARDLLSVLDNFERALETKLTPETIETYKKGIELTANEIKTLLQKNGIQELPGMGQKFDPQYFEALSSEETDQYEPGVISRVFKKAYKFHDKMLRVGQVVIAKAKSPIN